MKRTSVIVIIVIAAIALLGGCSAYKNYNGLVEKQENVNNAWAQVQNVYQRRADLIPNLVSTVKGAANFEKGTLVAVQDARSKATSINLSADQLTPENIQRFQVAQDQLKGSLSRLLAVAENYPQLKANQGFLDLQAQLEGSENRITTERKGFNVAVQEYNTSRRRFPSNIFAGLFGFDAKGYFQSQAGADKAPTVQF